MTTKLQYGIRILIIHPTLPLDEISSEFGLESRVRESVGERRFGPTGIPLGSVWLDTRWSVWEVRHGDRYFFKRLDKVLDRFTKHRDFLRRIADTGGETNFIVEVPGEANIGDDFPAGAVAKLADLKGSLGFEVYPGMNPREEKRIWADDP